MITSMSFARQSVHIKASNGTVVARWPVNGLSTILVSAGDHRGATAFAPHDALILDGGRQQVSSVELAGYDVVRFRYAGQLDEVNVVTMDAAAAVAAAERRPVVLGRHVTTRPSVSSGRPLER